MTEKTADKLSELISELTYIEWRALVKAVEKEFAPKIGKVEIADPEAVKRMLRLELPNSFSDDLNA